MSKYIKLEDAIEQVKTEFYGGGYQEWLEISIDNLINRIANLPTIEVSEDCISREWLEQEIERERLSDTEPDIHYGWNIALDKVVKIIKNAPSVTTEQSSMVGEWKHDGSDWENRWICNLCNYKLFEERTNYCPNCGAMMKGAEEE